MDRRTIILVVSFFLVLFGVNWFFEKDHAKKMEEWQKQRQIYRQTQIEKLEKKMKQQKVSFQDLSIKEVYADSKQEELVGYVFLNQDFLLSFNILHDANPLFLDKISYDLVQNLNLPIRFYQKSKASLLPYLELPSSGSYPLQIIRWREDPFVEPDVFAAEYLDGQITLFLQKLQTWQQEEGIKDIKTISSSPRYGLAVVKIKDQYQSVGIYDFVKNTLRQWRSFPALNEIFESQASEKRNGVKTEQEKFYVLENDFVQLVVSNYGGALAEINLPFQTEQNQKSVVKEIGFDREIQQFFPLNARFPFHSFSMVEDGKVITKKEGKEGGYYPLIRRDLFDPSTESIQQVPPDFYALNIVSDYPEVAKLIYQVKNFTKDSIELEAKQSYRKITKKYSLPDSKQLIPYIINLDVEIDGDANGLWITSGVPEVELISGSPAPSLKYRVTKKNKREVLLIDLPKETVTVTSAQLDWLSNSNGFFGMIMDPKNKEQNGYRVNRVSGELIPSRLTLLGGSSPRFKPDSLPGFMSLLPISSKEGILSYRFFVGPYDARILNQVDAIFQDPVTKENPDFIASQTFHGWFAFISEPFAKFLFFLMNMFHSFTNSWGLSIIVLTVALRIMLYPLNAWSSRSMYKMQEISPKMQAINEKYKNDPQKAKLEIMALYREAKVNPLSGCFPLLIQMPFLIGMFDLLKSSFALRGASFIPGWIDNLSAPDVLFSWDANIPFFGHEFHLLPFILGGLFFVQTQFFSQLPKDPSQMTDSQRQQKTMGTMSAVLMTFIFYNMPSGLNIYFISNNILGMLQQWWTMKRMKKTKALQKEKRKV